MCESVRTLTAVFLDYANLYAEDLDRQPLEKVFRHISWHADTPQSLLVERLQDADVAIVSDISLTAAIFSALPALKLVLVASTGTDNIDLAAANHHGVTVCHCRDYATWSLAQHAFALLLTLTNNTIRYDRLIGEGAWQQANAFCLPCFPLNQLAGKTLGIVGYGASGQRMAIMAKAFGMQVKVAALQGRPAATDRIELESLLPQVDVLSLHCPLSDETRNLLDARRLAMMKPEALLINVARGAIVDALALAEALRAGHLAGAGLDVLHCEPPPDDHPLLQRDIPNLLITPHISWSSRPARQEILNQLAENAQAFAAGQPRRTVTSST
ncbi:NAD(P)-dependent oxidoreductase [Serratia proteamaculans]|uniref:NAD(P)-dependent oxidoreductase n=1 Tax=Serratia proteamaculans TaxID=28151 RepID=UPI003CFCF489